MKKLYRGDTRVKGLVFNNDNNDYIGCDGKAKNRAWFHFFTDSYSYAKEYATSEMNSKVRINHNQPNITTVEIDNLRLFDFNAMTIEDASRFCLAMNDDRKDFLHDVLILSEKKLVKKYKWVNSFSNRKVVARDITEHPQCYSDNDRGLKFRAYLIENGYDGFVFKEYVSGSEFGLLDTSLFKVISNELL